jgi:hypothetical protein
VILSRRLSVHGHSKADWLTIGACAEHKVQITSMKAEGDLPSRGLEHCSLASINPLPGKRPLVQSQMIRQSVEMLRISLNPARGGKLFRASVADIGLGRANIAHVGGSLHSLPMDADRARRRRLCIRLFQQLLDPSLGLVIVALAEVLESHFAFQIA